MCTLSLYHDHRWLVILVLLLSMYILSMYTVSIYHVIKSINRLIAHSFNTLLLYTLSQPSHNSPATLPQPTIFLSPLYTGAEALISHVITPPSLLPQSHTHPLEPLLNKPLPSPPFYTGAEALISHVITQRVGVPCAHAPAFASGTLSDRFHTLS